MGSSFINNQTEGPFIDVPPGMGEYGTRQLEAERVLAAEEAARPAPTFDQKLSAAKREEDTIAVAMSATQVPHNPDYVYTREMFDEDTKGLPESYRPAFYGVYSEAHRQWLKAKAHQELEDNKMLASGGPWSDFGYRALASLTDPVQVFADVASGALTGGLAPAAIKASRLRRMLAAGTVAAGENVAIDAYLANHKVDSDSANLVMSASLGFGLGSIGGAFSHAEATKLRQLSGELVDNHVLDEVRTNGETHGLTIPGEPQPRATDLGLPEPEGSLSAAQTPGTILPHTPNTDFANIRFDAYASLARQVNPVFRKMNELINGDPSPGAHFKDYTAAEYSAMTHQEFLGRVRQAEYEAWNEYRIDRGVSMWQSEKARKQFNELVTEATRSGRTDYHPAVLKVAKQLADVRREIIEEAKRHGVEGADAIQISDHYITRMHSQDNRLRLKSRLEEAFGGDFAAARAGLIEAIAGSFRSAQGHLEAEKSLKIAKEYLVALEKLNYSKEFNRATLSASDYEKLAEELRKDRAIDEADLETVMEYLTGYISEKNADGSKIARFKGRALIDENYEHVFANGTRMKISEMFENDASLIMSRYVRQLSGAIGFAKVGIKSAADFQRMLREADDWAGVMEHGVSKETHARHRSYLEQSFNLIMGIPVEDMAHSKLLRAAKILRDYNFFRLMWNAGFAQLSDMGNVIGAVGLKAMLRSMPAGVDLFKALKGGHFDDQLGKDITRIFGVGTEMMDAPNLRDTNGLVHDRVLTQIENATERMKWATARGSGMASLNNMISQLSYRFIVSKLVGHALDGAEKLSETQLNRLRSSGLKGNDLKGVLSSLKKYSNLDENSRLSAIDFEAWQRANPEQFDRFKIAVMRESNRSMQKLVVGEAHPWMHKLAGQTLFQFRSFMLGAYPKMLLYGLSHRDMQTLNMWAFSMLFGGASYVVQTHATHAGNQEELDKRLATDEIAKAAFQRAGFSSLIPALVDTATDFTSGEPVFRYGRSTQQATSLFSNPTTNGVMTLLDTSRNIGKSLFDDEYMATQKDVRNGLGTILPNQLLIKNFINKISEDYPKRNPLREPLE